MPNKEPGAIRQLFAFVGERNSKMRISILLAVLGEMFGIVPFLRRNLSRRTRGLAAGLCRFVGAAV